MNFGTSLKSIDMAFRKNGNRILVKYGLTVSQMAMLLYLFHQKDEGRTVIQREIEEALSLKTPTVSGTLDRLEKNGFLERRPDPVNRRVNRIVLTEKADAVKQDGRDAMDAFEKKVLSPLNEQEQALLQDLLLRILQNLPE